MDTTSHDWSNSFEEFFASYFDDNADSRTITLLYWDSYLTLHNPEIPVFEEVPNYHNFAPSCHLKNPDPKSCSNK